MDIDIIFKIAGIGIASAVLQQVLVKAGGEESGNADHAGRGDRCADAGDPDDRRIFRCGQNFPRVFRRTLWKS